METPNTIGTQPKRRKRRPRRKPRGPQKPPAGERIARAKGMPVPDVPGVHWTPEQWKEFWLLAVQSADQQQPGYLPPDEREMVKRLHESGMSIERLRKLLGISNLTVLRAIDGGWRSHPSKPKKYRRLYKHFKCLACGRPTRTPEHVCTRPECVKEYDRIRPQRKARKRGPKKKRRPRPAGKSRCSVCRLSYTLAKGCRRKPAISAERLLALRQRRPADSPSSPLTGTTSEPSTDLTKLFLDPPSTEIPCSSTNSETLPPTLSSFFE